MNREGEGQQVPKAVITDSPWFWVYAFATAGLVLMVLAGPKWITRQARLDQRAEGIRWSMSVSESKGPETSQGDRLSDDEDAKIRWRQQFRILVSVMALTLAIAWIGFFVQRRRLPVKE